MLTTLEDSPTQPTTHSTTNNQPPPPPPPTTMDFLLAIAIIWMVYRCLVVAFPRVFRPRWRILVTLVVENRVMMFEAGHPAR